MAYCEKAAAIIEEYESIFPTAADLLTGIRDLDEKFRDCTSDYNENTIDFFKDGMPHLLGGSRGNELLEELIRLASEDKTVGDMLLQLAIDRREMHTELHHLRMPRRLLAYAQARLIDEANTLWLVDGCYALLKKTGADEETLSNYRNAHLQSPEMASLERQARKASGNVESELQLLETDHQLGRLQNEERRRLFELLEQNERIGDACQLACTEIRRLMRIPSEPSFIKHQLRFNAGFLKTHFVWISDYKRLAPTKEWTSLKEEMLKPGAVIPDILFELLLLEGLSASHGKPAQS